MGTFKYCTRCAKLFTSTGSLICQKCVAKEEEEYVLVKEYIYENEGANIVEVSKGTEVPVESILRFLKEERLLMTIKDGNIVLVCENCGKAIQTGRYCADCKRDLVVSMKHIIDNATNSMETQDTLERKAQRMFTAEGRRRVD